MPQSSGEHRELAGVDRRAYRALGVVALVYAALVATHGGDFWPFSVYPMFARAGKPWARALVRELDPGGVEGAAVKGSSDTQYSLERLPGAPLALGDYGIPQNDLSSLVQRWEGWTEKERAALSQLLGRVPCERPLLVLRVRGALGGRAVDQRATPVAWSRCKEGKAHVEAMLPPGSAPSGGASP